MSRERSKRWKNGETSDYSDENVGVTSDTSLSSSTTVSKMEYERETRSPVGVSDYSDLSTSSSEKEKSNDDEEVLPDPRYLLPITSPSDRFSKNILIFLYLSFLFFASSVVFLSLLLSLSLECDQEFDKHNAESIVQEAILEFDVYECSGTCYCDDVISSTKRSSAVLTRVILPFLVAAVSSAQAFDIAKDIFSTECVSDCKGESSIRSEVDACDVQPLFFTEEVISDITILVENAIVDLHEKCISISQSSINHQLEKMEFAIEERENELNEEIGNYLSSIPTPPEQIAVELIFRIVSPTHFTNSYKIIAESVCSSKVKGLFEKSFSCERGVSRSFKERYEGTIPDDRHYSFNDEVNEKLKRTFERKCYLWRKDKDDDDEGIITSGGIYVKIKDITFEKGEPFGDKSCEL